MSLGMEFFLLLVLFTMSHAIDYMPCTEGVAALDMALARRLLEESTPPEHRLTEFYPVTQTGRNPHRWICHFERVDNVYRHDCAYLTSLRTAFRRRCPLGCEISQVAVSDSANRQFIIVEFLVNCGCVKQPRRRRNIDWRCPNSNPQYFVTEKSTCTGISTQDK